MLNLIKQIFWNKKKQTPQKKLYISAINFLISYDGKVDIVCEWPIFNEENSDKIKDVAYFYAIAIYALNNGFLKKETINTLKKHNKENPFDSLFIHNVLTELINIEKLQKKEDLSNCLPMVSPIEVFKHYQ